MFSASTKANIAKYVLAVLSRPEISRNRYIYASSFEICQNDILKALEELTGGESWEVKKVSSEDMIREGREGMAKGDRIAAGKLALGSLYSEDNVKYRSDFEEAGKSDNQNFQLFALFEN